MKLVHISPKLLKSTIGKDGQRMYATWLFLKQLYSNGCVFNYTVQSLSTKSGLSRSSIRKYIPLFLKKGWCRLHEGNLIFNRHHAILNKSNPVLLSIEPFKCTVKGILNALYAFLLSDYQRQQVFRINVKVRKHDRNNGDAPGENVLPVMTTIRQAARLFKKTARNANRIILDLQKEGWFNRYQQRVTLQKATRKTFQILKDLRQLPLTAFWRRGYIVQPVPSLWEWIDKPDATTLGLNGHSNNESDGQELGTVMGMVQGIDRL